MKNLFESVLRWFSGPRTSGGAHGVRGPSLSDYDRRLRELEERSGRLFLPRGVLATRVSRLQSARRDTSRGR